MGISFQTGSSLDPGTQEICPRRQSLSPNPSEGGTGYQGLSARRQGGHFCDCHCLFDEQVLTNMMASARWLSGLQRRPLHKNVVGSIPGLEAALEEGAASHKSTQKCPPTQARDVLLLSSPCGVGGQDWGRTLQKGVPGGPRRDTPNCQTVCVGGRGSGEGGVRRGLCTETSVYRRSLC